MRDHRKLEAFQLGHQLVIEVYKRITRFPVSERYGLEAQIRRATVSVPTNIVEGAARHSTRDFVRFLYFAFASLREMAYLVELAGELGFVPTSAVQELQKLEEKTARKLTGLIRSVKSFE